MHRDPEVERLLDRLVEDQRQALGPALTGCYLFGSVVTGDFEPGISDVDTVVVLADDPTSAELMALERLHRNIVERMPEWDDRVECVYLSSGALRNFRTARSPAARISPGEPFHAIELDPSWVLDWYPLRTVGEPLWGPPPSTLVPPIPKPSTSRRSAGTCSSGDGPTNVRAGGLRPTRSSRCAAASVPFAPGISCRSGRRRAGGARSCRSTPS